MVLKLTILTSFGRINFRCIEFILMRDDKDSIYTYKRLETGRCSCHNAAQILVSARVPIRTG